jgi:hypothetical protein
MKNLFIIFFSGLIFYSSTEDEIMKTNFNNLNQISGEELLNKSISYHDPNNSWKNFNGVMNITMTRPDKSQRNSEVEIDVLRSFFRSKVIQDENTIEQIVENDLCKITLNGKSTFSEDEIKKHRLTCDFALKMRNYYTYLYGLPMKLKDPGTIINPKVTTKNFKGKEYLVLTVDYEEPVGKDRWYFYFNPKSYALEVYQFFHEESKNDGEYILLSEEKEISGIKMPKIRSWFYNEKDKFLGTDTLN